MTKSFFRALLLINLLSAYCFAQQNDYYKLPKEREIEDGRITLPNLKTNDVYWYASVNGGLKIQQSELTNSYEGRIQTIQPNKLYWEASLGLNKADLWQFELGYLNNPLSLEYQLFDRSNRLVPFFFNGSFTDHSFSATYKKRLFTLDKVTRKTRLNLLLGLKYSPMAEAQTINDFDITYIPPLGGRGIVDTLAIKSSFDLDSPWFSGITGLELIGRVADPIEIGLFGKLLIDSKNTFGASINVESTSSTALESRLRLNQLNWLMGVTLRWNFHHAIEYTSKEP
ncbi:hypothetical protein [Jiulongibacter sp. NS-SX5]|uniref:hypothetical protein n=1 Tax=Jiulongibacter sp. NS-SX5 TaxID=3463854 RepID=UPI004059BFA0